MPGDEIRHRLDESETDDEGNNEGVGGDAELLGADQRHDGPLQADHAADKGIDDDEQRELLPVLPQPKSDIGHQSYPPRRAYGRKLIARLVKACAGGAAPPFSERVISRRML